MPLTTDDYAYRALKERKFSANRVQHHPRFVQEEAESIYRGLEKLAMRDHIPAMIDCFNRTDKQSLKAKLLNKFKEIDFIDVHFLLGQIYYFGDDLLGISRDIQLAAKYFSRVLPNATELLVFNFKKMLSLSLYEDMLEDHEINIETEVEMAKLHGEEKDKLVQIKRNVEIKYARLQEEYDRHKKDQNDLAEALKQYNIILTDYTMRDSFNIKIELSQGETDFIEAVKQGNLDSVKKYLENGGDPNPRSSEYDDTTLHHAVRTGNNAMLSLLLQYYNKYGLFIDILESEKQDTPLKLACCHGERNIITTLLETGANPFLRFGHSPYAAYSAFGRSLSVQASDALTQYTQRKIIHIVLDDCDIYLTIGFHGRFHRALYACLDFRERSEGTQRFLSTMNEYLASKNCIMLDESTNQAEISAMQTFHILSYFQQQRMQGAKLTCNSKKNIGQVRDIQEKIALYAYPNSARLRMNVLFNCGMRDEIAQSADQLQQLDPFRSTVSLTKK